MSDDRNPEIDPRFDPAFQRGFDPSIPIEEYVPDPLPRRAAATVPAANPVPAPEALPPVPSVAEVQEAAHASDAAAAPPEVPELDSSPSRNPFLLFLVLISIALVAVGIWLFIRSGDAFNSSQVRSQGDYMSLDATIHAAPFIALLGGATAIGVLFVFASKWRRRR